MLTLCYSVLCFDNMAERNLESCVPAQSFHASVFVQLVFCAVTTFTNIPVVLLFLIFMMLKFYHYYFWNFYCKTVKDLGSISSTNFVWSEKLFVLLFAEKHSLCNSRSQADTITQIVVFYIFLLKTEFLNQFLNNKLP